ncbi:MAG: chloramphenicol acetyltransferase [Saprospiraceae bacterium]|nr:chloramphenicol acetyltransferase [Lewinella sp.]
MRKLTFPDPHRRKHFDFFRAMDMPHFSICLQLDITETLRLVRSENLHFTSTIVYLVSRTANNIAPFRQRIRGEAAVEHEQVHPSFTVQTRVSDVFSFCQVNYLEDYVAFATASRVAIERMQNQPSFEDEAGRDDLLFLSSFPWGRFTGLTHAMHYSPVDSVPRITWGKFYEQGKRVLMPLSVQAHHALVDGKHVGQYCELFESLASETSLWIP